MADEAPAEAPPQVPAEQAAPAAQEAANEPADEAAPAAEEAAPAAEEAAQAAEEAKPADEPAPADETPAAEAPAAEPAAEEVAVPGAEVEGGAGGMTAQEIDVEAQRLAAIKIQQIQRGRQTRKVLAENDLEGARAIFEERNLMQDAGMEAKMLARTNAGSQVQDEQSNVMDSSVAIRAHKIAEQHKHEEEIAAVRMQSMYRGFRDRRQVRSTREDAEMKQRNEIAQDQAKKADQAAQSLEQQTVFTAGGIERNYLNLNNTRKGGPSARRSPGKTAGGAQKAVLTPTLVDKKANMTAVQKKACIILEENIKKWATSYARAVELAPGAEKTGALEFVALFSKPSKEEPIAWPVVRVYLKMKNDFETQLVPQVTYQLEGEKMKFDTNTDLGRRFKESWLDRIVMDKRAIRADMALRHKN